MTREPNLSPVPPRDERLLPEYREELCQMAREKGLEILDPETGMVVCRTCGTAWSPELRHGAFVSGTWWRCPSCRSVSWGLQKIS